ncbi:MAG: phosphocholine cytidylyltransferase family protein [Sphingomonadales bacterium]|uniref:phosphocholine cytidylyltransferase family protein n=1 Tax=Sphingomonas sp. TaxID=28214 RepID=UPI0011D2F5F1|nr:sugar phosphate nucleotidyltransferase [Sphingomonas sp.]TXG82078.1 MAG: phosphocholine cytidylyltransferase family protein [Sphingomonadales bacterium]
MQAVILSAGRGSRLLPLTQDMPKSIVPMANGTILDQQLAALAQAGIARAMVVVGYRADQIKRHLAARHPPIEVELRFNPFWAVASSIGSVWAARDVLHNPFCLMNGDSSFASAIIERAIAVPPRSVGLVVEPLGVPEEDDMLVRVDEGAVIRVSKSLATSYATHRSLGIIVGARDSGYGDALARVIGEADGYAAYHHDVISALAQTEPVEALVETSGDWIEIDRPDDILRWTARRGQ